MQQTQDMPNPTFEATPTDNDSLQRLSHHEEAMDFCHDHFKKEIKKAFTGQNLTDRPPKGGNGI